MTDPQRNDPTWLEYLIVYVVLGLTFFFLYQSVLSPRGYTFAAGWAKLRGKPAAEVKAENKKDEKPADMNNGAKADNAGKESPESEKTDMKEKTTLPASPMPAVPMVAPAPEEPMKPAAPMPLSEEDD